MELTLTAKVPWYPPLEQTVLLQQTVEAYRQGCNAVSGVVDTPHGLQQAVLHADTIGPCEPRLVCARRWRNR